MTYFPVYDNIQISLISLSNSETAGMFIVSRSPLLSDRADVYAYDRVHEYVSLKSNKTAVAPIIQVKLP